VLGSGAVEYKEYTGSLKSAREIISWAGVRDKWYYDAHSGVMKVSNFKGEIHAQPGNMILRGNGEFYPCRKDVCLKLFGGENE